MIQQLLKNTISSALVIFIACVAPTWGADPGLEAALQLQDAFTKVAEKASPSVVVITNKQNPGKMVQYGNRLPPELREFFGIPDLPRQPGPPQQLPVPAGKGSGVIISTDGYVVTNYHVIKDNDALEVKLFDGRIFDSDEDDQLEVIGFDEETDLAVLRIGKGEIKDLPHAQFGDSDQVKVGHWTIAVGAPFNFDYSVTVGVVSQKGRYDVRMNTYENYIQTDASINPGNSGGPLLNIKGEIIGINDFIITGGGASRGNVGIGFAISSNLAKDIVDDLIANGKVIRPWMGIAMQPMDDQLRGQFKVDYGVLISDVIAGDPADQAGLKTGDVILQIDGHKMTSAHDVQFAVLGFRPGSKIPVLVDRKGKKMTFHVTLRRRDGSGLALSGTEQKGDVLDNLGMRLGLQDGKIVVTGVNPVSPAAKAGLAPGDIICEVNRKEVKTVEEAVTALKETSGDLALVCRERDGRKQFLTIKVKE